MCCEWPDVVKSIVKEGEAIGLLCRDCIEDAITAGWFKALNVSGVNLSVISYILYSREKRLSEPAQRFLRLLRHAGNRNTGGAFLQKVEQAVLLWLAVLVGMVEFVLTT